MNNINNDKRPFKLPPYEVKHVIATLSQTQDWGIKQSNTPQAWKITKGEGVVVMVLDTGYTNHTDLKGALLVDKCITTIDNDKTDHQYHSTHCCGIIGARDNDIGCVGYSPECKIITVKVLGDDGTGSFDAIVKGLEYAAKIRPDIISMSLGAPVGSEEMHNAIKKLYDMGIPIVAAAGNDGNDSPVNFPARYPECLAVAAVDKNGNIANFSCAGTEVFISCAGVDVYSTYGNNTYAKLSGTSMATPALAGIIALLIAKHRKQEKETGKNDCVGVEQIKEHLRKYAIDRGIIGKDNNFGWGVINTATLIEAQGDDISQPTPTPNPLPPKAPTSFWKRFTGFWKRLWR